MYSKLNENKQYLTEEDSIILGADGKPLQKDDNENKDKKSTPDSIFTEKQELAVGKNRQKIEELLKSGAVQDFPNFNSWGKTFQNIFIDSILDRGPTRSQNPFLQYADIVKDHKPITGLSSDAYDGLVTLKNILEKGAINLKNLDINNIKNTNYEYLILRLAFRADDPSYKIKALTFLASPKAKNYGNEKTIKDVMFQVLESEKKSEIMQIVSNWQTKNGENEDGSSDNSSNDQPKDSGKKATDREVQRLIRQATNKMGKNFVVSRDQIENYITNNATTSDTVYSAVGKAIMSILNSNNN